MSASSARSSSAAVHQQKRRLFCADCGHESPSDGDWEYRRSASGLAVHCPVCESVLTTRPRDRAVTATPLSAPFRHTAFAPVAGGRFLARSVGVALEFATWPCDVVTSGHGGQ